MIKESIKKAVIGLDLDFEESKKVFDEIMKGEATSAQIAAFLTALRMKGETPDEILGAVKSMQQHCIRLESDVSPQIDTCGTGGDASGTFNISTAAAFVVAGTGIYVAKHGNRSVSSKSGSADLLESFGANISLPPDKAAHVLEKAHFTFMFAPLYHPAMKYAAGPRREVGVRTIFNLIGPIVNPASVEMQVIGIFSPAFLQKLAVVMTKLNKNKVFIVHSSDGLDELSVFTKNYIYEINGRHYENYELDVSNKFGNGSIADIKVKGVKESRDVIFNVLTGEEKNAARDIVVLNAAYAIMSARNSISLVEAIALAEESINSGNAHKALKNFIEESNK